MLHLLPGFLLGPLTVGLFALNLGFWAFPFFAVALAQGLAPLPAWRRRLRRALFAVAWGWVAGKGLVMAATQRVAWDIRLPPGLSPDGAYLVISNHRSWLDILVLFHAFRGKIPFPRFLLKRELIWLPIAGQACWAMDFPFLARYPRHVLVRRPELAHRDRDAIRRMCERARGGAVTVLAFPEGTRFSEAKRDRRGSPYRRLLEPKAGGVAAVTGAMGPALTAAVDVTLAYPGSAASLWSFACGQLPRIVVEAAVRELPAELLASGRDDRDPAVRRRSKAWLEGCWREKDARLGELEGDADGAPQAAGVEG